MKKLFTDKKFNIIWSVAAILLMWAVWLIAVAIVKNGELVPPFEDSAREFFTLFAKGFFWKSLGHTLLRTLISFLISFALALGCACLAAAFKPFAAFMRPIVAVCRTLPTMAVLLLILTWLAPRTAPVAVSLLVLFPMIYSQLCAGIEGVDGELLEMAKVYKLTAKQKLKSIYIPQILPAAVENAGTNLSFGIKIVISAEVMALTRTAIGGLMQESQAYYNYPRLAALTIWAVAFGIVLEVTFRLISKAAFKWKREAQHV